MRPRALRSAEFPEVTADGAVSDAGTAPASVATPSDPGAPGAERPAQPTLQLPGRIAPSGALLQIAAIGALILGGVAIVAFLRGRGAIDAPDAPPRRDAAPAPAIDAAIVPSTAPVDATAADAADPAPPPLAADAGVPPPRPDAGIRPPHPDARAPADLAPRPDAGAARPTGTATLTVGAIPWGTVLLDGKSIGRTPIERLTLPAGHHVVQVTFGGEDPPRTLSYALDLAAGETKDLLADFTRP